MTTLTFPMLAADCKVLSLWNGTANNPVPTNWQFTDFDDSAWTVPVIPPSAGGYVSTLRSNASDNHGASLTSQDFGPSPLLGADPVWASSSPASATERILIRWRPTLPQLVPDYFQPIFWSLHATPPTTFASQLSQAAFAGFSSLQFSGSLTSFPMALVVGQNLVVIDVTATDPSLAWIAYLLRFSSAAPYVWGIEGTSGQAGGITRGVSPINIPTPTVVPTIWGTKTIRAGYSHTTLWLTDDGLVYASGSLGDPYQFGRGASTDPTFPPVSSLIDPNLIDTLATAATIVDIGCGTNNAWALDTTGNLWTWGQGSGGENYPSGTDLTSAPPLTATGIPFITLGTVSQFSAGLAGALALLNDGTVVANGTVALSTIQWGRVPFLADVQVTAVQFPVAPYFLMADGTVRSNFGGFGVLGPGGNFQAPSGTSTWLNGVRNNTINTVGVGIWDFSANPPVQTGVFSILQNIVQIADGANQPSTFPGTCYLDGDGVIWIMAYPAAGSVEALSTAPFAPQPEQQHIIFDPVTGLSRLDPPVVAKRLAGQNIMPGLAFIGVDDQVYTYGGVNSRASYLNGDGTSTFFQDPPVSTNGLTNVRSVFGGSNPFFAVLAGANLTFVVIAGNAYDLSTNLPQPILATVLGRGWAEMIG